MIRNRFLLGILLVVLSWGTLSASERTILIGPKTIGPGWKDNILIKAEQFQNAGVGDIMTVYTTEAKRTAQIAFQDPKTWQGVAPEYGAVSVQGPVRMKMTDLIFVVGDWVVQVLEHHLARAHVMGAAALVVTFLLLGFRHLVLLLVRLACHPVVDVENHSYHHHGCEYVESRNHC